MPFTRGSCNRGIRSHFAGRPERPRRLQCRHCSSRGPINIVRNELWWTPFGHHRVQRGDPCPSAARTHHWKDNNSRWEEACLQHGSANKGATHSKRTRNIEHLHKRGTSCHRCGRLLVSARTPWAEAIIRDDKDQDRIRNDETFTSTRLDSTTLQESLLSRVRCGLQPI